MTETMIEAMMSERIHVMDAGKAVNLIQDLCSQLDSSGMTFHGNIWPGNVCLNDEDGSAVLGDTSDAAASERNAVQVEYLPPEFFWDERASASGDVYSLGLLLYACCNGGCLPFQPKGGTMTDRDRSEALRRRMKGEPITLPAGTDPRLGAVILKALAYEPEARYQSAGELMTALSTWDEPVEEAELPAEDAPAEENEDPLNAELSHLASDDIFTEETAEEAESTACFPVIQEEPELPAMTPERDTAIRTSAEPVRKASPSTDAKTSKKAARKASTIPATRRKKKASPVIPILCLAAIAVIGGAAWVGFNHGGALIDRLTETFHPSENSEVSAPYVIVPAETPEVTAPPAPSSVEDTVAVHSLVLEEPAPTAKPEPTPEPTPEPIVGSSAVDGMDVELAEDVVVVSTSGTNLRSGPGTGYDIAVTLARGIKMQRTGTVNGWSQVQYEGEEYYVSSNLVEVDENTTVEELAAQNERASATPAPEAIALEAVNSAAIVTDPGKPSITGTGTGTTAPTASNVTATRDVVSATSDVNLRSGPGTGYSVVTTVSAGTTLQRTGTINGWSRVTYNGSEVYVINTYITTAGTSSAGSSTAGDSSVNSGSGTLTVTADVNVRTGPTTDDSIIGVAKKGEQLTVTGVTSDSKWYRVAYNGQQGYVNRKLVSVSNFSLTSGTTNSDSTASTSTATVKQLANIRSGPGTGYGILGQASAGTTLTVLGHTDSNWYKVSFNGTTGYIAGSLVSVN